MRRQKNLQRAAGVTLSALLLAGAAASPALAANVSARHDLTAVLTLANDNLYRPSSIGGTYLGVNDDGLYEFEVTISADFQSQPTPLEPDHYYSQHEISNPEVLGSRAQYYYGIRPGKSDITYSVSETHGGTYVPKAIVHVTVVTEEDYLALTGLDHIHKWYYSYDFNDPTCTHESVSSRRCTICDQTEIIQRKEKTGHQYISYVSTQPTAYAEGVRIYRCKVCGDTYTESIPKLSGDSGSTTTPSTPSQKPGSGTVGNNGTAAGGISGTGGSESGAAGSSPQSPTACTRHSWKYESRAASCEKEGGYVRVCQTCGAEEMLSTTPKLGHQYTASVTTPATASRTGVRTYVCSRCGDSYPETIPKLGTTQESSVTKDPNAKAAVTKNQSRQNYSTYGNVMTSHLYEREDGNFTRVEAANGSIVIENYDADFQLLTAASVPMELNLFGGFYAGEGFNFLIFGQKNLGESQSQEVIRAVKYSKDWERLGAVSLKGANTYIPFDAGSLRCAEYSGMLYILTCHEMFKSSDGLNHQSNMLISVRESDMTITDSRYGVSNIGTGYVSHSFNQFITVDSSGRLVTLDHGDAYPRAAVLCQYNTTAGSEKFGSPTGNSKILTFHGAVGANNTNASVGGLAYSADQYLSVLNTAPQDGSAGYQSARNVVLSITSRSGLSSKTVQLTNYAAGGNTSASTPQIVKLSNDRFLVLWEVYSKGQYGGFSSSGTLGFAVVDGSGRQVGQVQTAQGSLSDCQPIAVGGKAVWYVTNNSVPTFYTLDQSGRLTAAGDTGSGTAQQTAQPAVPGQVAQPGQAAGSSDTAGFRDVPANAYYKDAVAWAVGKNITGGTSANTFSPNTACSRAQIVTFLWRSAGSPAPKSQNNPFQDVKDGTYYYNAVLWAAEQGITGGVAADAFAPETTVTRAQAVTFLYRWAGMPDTGSTGAFTDVAGSAYYAGAVAWANEQGITGGTGNGKFSPEEKCTRGQIVTFLYRNHLNQA